MSKRTLLNVPLTGTQLPGAAVGCPITHTHHQKKMCLVLLLSLLFSFDSAPPQSQAFPRASPFVIPMISGSYDNMEWGEADRTADHATVAINGERDILVAYHSTRDDIQDTVGQHHGFHEPLKQVEIAFFRYDSTNVEWNLTSQKLIGSTEHDPLPSSEQAYVRCERPDVIAVGNRFFVVWTRRYDRDQPGYAEEPAILECAWVEWNTSTSTLEISGGLYPGLGYQLDNDYWVRECAGVPDAVLLDTGSASSTVGVVYAHQSDFGDDLDGNDNQRLCDLRIVVTSIAHSTNQLSITNNPAPLVTDIKFNGPTAPQGQEAAGLILPDCARGQRDPSTNAFRFWLSFEEQYFPPSGQVPDGRIRLGLLEQNSTGSWDALGTLNFGSAGSPFARRRPNLSSYPEGASGDEVVSIAFSKTNTTDNDDVVHQVWQYSPEGGLFLVPAEYGHAFVNTGDDHTRPIPLHGRNDPLVRRLYVVSHESTSELLEYDVDSNTTTTMRSTNEDLGRPAVAYWAGSGSVPDDFVLTWEERAQGVTETRIWLRVN